jgi:DNA-binding transcriptional LysR family regulator
MTSIEFRPPMNLNQLRALEALEATRSFTGAAHRLGLTQPAVSVQLRKLQERHGVKLFWRRGRYLDAILFSLPYCDQSIVLFVSIHPPRAKRPCLDAIALDDQPMVARHRGSMTRQIFERRLARQSIRPRVVMELDAWEALKEAVAAEIGFGIALEDEFAHDSRLIGVPVRDMDLSAAQFFVCLPEFEKLQAVQAFFGLVGEIKNQRLARRTAGRLDLPAGACRQAFISDPSSR